VTAVIPKAPLVSASAIVEKSIEVGIARIGSSIHVAVAPVVPDAITLNPRTDP